VIHDQNLDGLGKLSTSVVLGYYTYFSVYTVISLIIYPIEVTLQISNKKEMLGEYVSSKMKYTFLVLFLIHETRIQIN
jgi:hypothetical protein